MKTKSSGALKGIAVLLPALLAASPAQAYIGPGAGLGAIGTLVALVAAMVLLAVGFVWYPLKRFLRRRGGSEADREPRADDR